MNAPSQTPEAAGLEVARYEMRQSQQDDGWSEMVCSPDGYWVKYDDAAASAQAAIDAEKARADRLANLLETLEAERKREGVNLAHLKRAVAVAYADMNCAALQQETQR